MQSSPYLLPSYLALALAGVCLTCAELDFLPELVVGLPFYLGLVALAWRWGGQRTLPNWAANLLGLVIVAGVALWVWARLGDEGTWTEDTPFPGILIPYLGPVLMALLAVRLFRSAPGEFWALQGLGLLQVALACVLASGTLFGLLLLAYLVVGLSALSIQERLVGARLGVWCLVFGVWSLVARRDYLSRQTPTTTHEPRGLGFVLRWALAVAVVGGPLFLLVPRPDVPDWEPLARFAQASPGSTGRTGFSEEIDLRRTGNLAVENSIAFRVVVTDAADQPYRNLPADQRWRGLVLDRYAESIWRCELSWAAGSRIFRPPPKAPTPGPDQLQLAFAVPRRTGGLFLADPVRLTSQPGDLSIRLLGRDVTLAARGRGRRGLLFYEAGGTAVPSLEMTRPEYRYVQHFDVVADRDRSPAFRLSDGYLGQLLRCPVQELGPWAFDLLRRLAGQPRAPAGLREALAGERPAGWSLPPRLWEPAARLLNDHLASSGEYRYSLTQRREVVSIDPVMDFLTNVKEGNCERYAAGLTLLLRSVGIPARIVKGYRGAEHRGGGNYEVRQNQAHAWVEAVVPARRSDGLEWITLDPTPATDAPDPGWALWLQQQQGLATDVWRDLVVNYGVHQQADLWAEFTPDHLLLAAPLVGLAGIAFVLVRLHRRQRRRRKALAASGKCAGLYERLLALLTGPLGMRPGPEQTPRELAEQAAVRLRTRPTTEGLAGVPGRVVELLYRGRWGGEPATEEELAETGRLIDALGQALAAPA